MKLEIKNGRFTYPHSDRIILDDVSFSLDGGDVLAILGPNGAGKTTLLRCMMGLLKWQSGKTLLDDCPLQSVPQKTLWQKVSYVPQAKQALMAYTVEEMILLGRASMVNTFSVPGKSDMDAVDRCITKTNLESLRHRSCAELSGGEFQMVLIARALASEPEILILDEPESNLDFQNQLLVLNMISELSAEGITCIFNTHYPAHALRRGTKAFMLGKNGTYCFGPVHDIVTEENILRYYGVRSVIGELETENATFSDVIPISIEDKMSVMPSRLYHSDRVIAGITVLMDGNAYADALNGLLHEYGNELIGRMGLPYRKAGVNIITLTLDTTAGRVHGLADKIARLPGTHVKTTYIAGDTKNEYS